MSRSHVSHFDLFYGEYSGAWLQQNEVSSLGLSWEFSDSLVLTPSFTLEDTLTVSTSPAREAYNNIRWLSSDLSYYSKFDVTPECSIFQRSLSTLLRSYVNKALFIDQPTIQSGTPADRVIKLGSIDSFFAQYLDESLAVSSFYKTNLNLSLGTSLVDLDPALWLVELFFILFLCKSLTQTKTVST